MELSQYTSKYDAIIAAVGTLTVSLFLLYRLKDLYNGSDLDALIDERVSRLRAALRLLIHGASCVQKEESKRDTRKEAKEEKEEEDAYAESPWDPSSRMAQVNCHRCKALLVEVLKRAAHDWVLYRTSSKLDKKELALDAYKWLFKEGPGHPDWEAREVDGNTITSFLAICEALDLDPDNVRECIRKLNVPAILHVGRPAETRRSKKSKRGGEEVQQHAVVDVSLDVLDQSDTVYMSQYEAHYATTTLGGE